MFKVWDEDLTFVRREDGKKPNYIFANPIIIWYYLLGKEMHESWFSSEFEITCACEKHCLLCEP